MSDLIGWYLTELRLHLDQKLSPAKLEEIVLESKAHLLEDIEVLSRNGHAEDVATRQALINFGQPQAVAIEHLEKLREGSLRFRASTLAILSGSFIEISLLVNRTLKPNNYIPAFVAIALLLIPLLIGVRRGSRSFAKPMALVSCFIWITYLMIVSVSFVTTPAPYAIRVFRGNLEQQAHSLQQSGLELAKYSEFIRTGRSAFANAHSIKEIPKTFWFLKGPAFSNSPNYRVPVVPWSGPYPDLVGTSSADNFFTAKSVWKERGVKASDAVNLLLSANKRDQEILSSAMNGRYFFFDKFTPIAGALVIAPALLVLCFLAGIVKIIPKQQKNWMRLVNAS